MECPRCTAALPDDDLYCEACGVRLTPSAPPGCTCGAPATEIDEDGFCARCGRKSRRPASDHLETVLSADCAAVSDRGVKHSRNEDRYAAIKAGRGYALVVCDGVSSSFQSEMASAAVAERVAAALAFELQVEPSSDRGGVMRNAIAEGQAAAGALPLSYAHENPPSTTVAAAMVDGNTVIVGWVGDSRVYWVDGNGALQLTKDHSWVNEMVAAGQMSYEEASKAPQAHAITRWMGADAGEYAQPDMMGFKLPGPGCLLVCSDGLWNYAPEPDHIAHLVWNAAGHGHDAVIAARNLVEFAIGKGGVDNITVILLRHWGQPKQS